jgi:hypothetical protein
MFPRAPRNWVATEEDSEATRIVPIIWITDPIGIREGTQQRIS